MSDKQKLSMTQLRHMNRCHRTWAKFRPNLDTVLEETNSLNVLRRDAAFSHLMGGMTVQLENFGSISRDEFVQLLRAATRFGSEVQF